MASTKQTILVTGDGGYIGTHTTLELLKQGFKVVIIENSEQEALNRVRKLVGPDLTKHMDFHLGGLRNKSDLEKLFTTYKFDGVIHFAGLKAVGESVFQTTAEQGKLELNKEGEIQLGKFESQT